MAILHIRNVPDPLYKRLQAQARRQHRSLAQEVIHLLSQAADQGQVPSILELRGLGKEAWRHVEARAHIARERRSWD